MRFIAIARVVFCVISWVMLLSKKGDTCSKVKFQNIGDKRGDLP